MGLPYICPYNVNSIMNPILVACLGLGYFFNMYRGKPLVREGGVVIMSHPTPWAFHPGHHPSYIDFFEQVLAETTDPAEIGKYEESFATDPWYVHLYRTGNAYHGVHPFYMWYWCAHALEHLGAVIIVGGDRAAVRRLGFKPATHHGRRPGDGLGRRGARPVAHPSALPAAAHGGRAMSAAPAPALEPGRGGRRRPDGFPWRAPDVAGEPRASRARAATWAPTTTPSGPGAIRPAWPAPSSLDNVTRPLAHIVASPEVRGDEILELVEAPAIYRRQPRQPRRHRAPAVGAARRVFATRPWWPPPPTTSSTGAGRRTCGPSSLAAIPIERHRVNRKSAEDTAALLREGWNLIIFPEGGRSHDGWFQAFRGGAAYLATRTGRPVVPVHIDGTYRIWPRGGDRLRRSPTRITFGSPITAGRGRGRPPARGEDRRRARPSWPTRRGPTGGRHDDGPARARPLRHAGPTPRHGGGPGRSAPTLTPDDEDDDGRWALVDR